MRNHKVISKDLRAQNIAAHVIDASLILIIIVHGKIKRIRNCVGEKNIKYFSRFIFYHALMCFFTFYLVSKVFIIEYAYIIERYNGVPPGFRNHLEFGLNYIATKPEVFFFWFITLMTSLALIYFSIYINTKYMRNLTMNEEYKYETPFEVFNKQMDKINVYLKDKTEIPYSEFEKVKKDIADAESWLRWYKKSYMEESYVGALFRMLFC